MGRGNAAKKTKAKKKKGAPNQKIWYGKTVLCRTTPHCGVQSTGCAPCCTVISDTVSVISCASAMACRHAHPTWSQWELRREAKGPRCVREKIDLVAEAALASSNPGRSSLASLPFSFPEGREGYKE